jgi:ubiquinone/menaquinone biosynthesis C-methylase UbiE
LPVEDAVAAHYAHGGLAAAIDAALRQSGRDPDRLTPEDLAPIDEFHTGGRQATMDLFAQVAPHAGQHWLDIGSGLGGPARYLAVAYGCRVTGIDLTAEYVAVAEDLARRVGLVDRVDFRQGSALDLPFTDASFDGAALLHVGMNLPDKMALCAGVHRVLVPGATFAIYDMMRVAEGDIAYPVPWAAVPETSFVATPDEYRAALQAAGFRIVAERRRTDFALDFFRTLQARLAGQARPPLGLHILMGENAPQKVANLLGNIERGVLAPTEIIATA